MVCSPAPSRNALAADNSRHVVCRLCYPSQPIRTLSGVRAHSDMVAASFLIASSPHGPHGLLARVWSTLAAVLLERRCGEPCKPWFSLVRWTETTGATPEPRAHESQPPRNTQVRPTETEMLHTSGLPRPRRAERADYWQALASPPSFLRLGDTSELGGSLQGFVLQQRRLIHIPDNGIGQLAKPRTCTTVAPCRNYTRGARNPGEGQQRRPIVKSCCHGACCPYPGPTSSGSEWPDGCMTDAVSSHHQDGSAEAEA